MQVAHSIAHMFNSISGETLFGKIITAAGSLAVAYISPIVGLLVACFATSMIDMYYGIKVARKYKKKITSGKTWKGTLHKIKDEFAILLLARLIEHTILGIDNTFILTGGAAVIITLTEMWSILENLNTLNPDGPWKSLGKFLKKKGEDFVGIELKHKDNEHTDDNTNTDKES